MMPHQQTPQPLESADHWLAFRYLTGDLSEAEWEAFEERLADEGAVQSALVEMTKLTSGLSEIDSRSRRRPIAVANPVQQPRLRPVGLSAVGLGAVGLGAVGLGAVGLSAAAVCLVGFGLLLRSPTSDYNDHASVQRDRHSTGVASADVPSVLAMWSALAPDDVAGKEQLDSSDVDGLETGAADDFAADGIEVPDWLLLAVADESDDAAPDDDPAGKPL